MLYLTYFKWIIGGICCLLGLSILAQDSAQLTALYPSSLTALDIDDGLPISCAASGIFDREKRLWINPCFSQAEHKTIPFYQLNGVNALFMSWENLPPGIQGQPAIAGCDQRTGDLYGFFRETHHFFVFNPENRRSKFYQLDSTNAAILLMHLSPQHELILYAITKQNRLIYQMKGDELHLMGAIPRLSSHEVNTTWWFPQSQVITNDEIWFFDIRQKREYDSQLSVEENFGALYCFNLSLKTTKKFTLKDFFSGELPSNPIFESGYLDLTNLIIIDNDGNLITYLGAWRQFFKINLTTNKISLLNDLPFPVDLANDPLFQVQLSKDEVGNILYLFVDLQKNYRCLLQDTSGRYFDYSAVANAAVDASRFDDGYIISLKSKNFKKHAFVFANGGIISVDLKLFDGLQVYLSKNQTRAIVETSPGRFMTIREGGGPVIFSTLAPDEEIQAFSLDCQGEQVDDFKLYANLKRDPQGNIWFPNESKLFQISDYQFCQSYPVGIHFNKFEVIDDQNFLLVAPRKGNQIYTYNLPSNQLKPVLINGRPLLIPGEVNEVMKGRDGLIWIASLGGLTKIDLEKSQSFLLGLPDGFQDEKMMCLHQDDRGRIWVGTYSGGLHIYDPAVGAIQIIDQEDGLSNNTVIGILPDSAGVRWLATYKGLTLVSEQGRVLTQLFEQDGLSTDEFNRYSYYKDSQNRLLFGSIYGINVIEPEAVKAQLFDQSDLHIYLTSIDRYNNKKNADATAITPSTFPDRIELPATHRYLNLKFALSSIINTDEQSFAYKIDRPGSNRNNDGWIFMGNRPEFNLYNLPSGKYNILVKGADYRGNWTPEPLVIKLHVKKFFYQQYWFYLAVLLALWSMAFIWVYRQRIARKKLEEELQQRTSEIMRARDQLIIQEKLASLGQLTAGIAHEIKNPLNFITNFSEDTIELVDELVEFLEAQQLHLEPDKKKDYEELINYLRDNANSIHKSGLRIDRIVQSMMAHAHNSSQEFVEMDLNDLIAENANLAYHGFRSVHSSFSADLKLQQQKNLPLVKGLRQDLGRVLINIFNNAFYAMHQKQQEIGAEFTPRLQITTQQNNGEIQITIRDNGPGMDEAVKEKIFTPFFTTKPIGSGNTGLGLSISHDIIRRHKGTIKVSSQKGQFTVFEIRLPLT